MNKDEQIEILKKKLKELKQEKVKLKNPKKGDSYKWFEYSQNNSGGSFVVNDNICENVYIEATSIEESNAFADSLGIYFDGVSMGIDCGCCGDRWHEPYQNLIFPYNYGSFTLKEVQILPYKYEKSKEWDGYDIVFETIQEYVKYLINIISFSLRSTAYLYDRNRKKTTFKKLDEMKHKDERI
jgi:hypothetical protein